MARTIPIAPVADDSSPSACEGSESFALRVLGDSMAPEFAHGEIVVIEPGGRIGEGAYVLAQVDGEWMLRQLCRDGARWQLRALDPALPVVGIEDLSGVRGVVIQRVRPGRRRETKSYVE